MLGGSTPGDSYIWSMKTTYQKHGEWVSIIPVGGLKQVGKIGKHFKTISKSLSHKGLLDLKLENVQTGKSIGKSIME
jgi:hypothetical protein